jgi:GGDEF domain-containing protein
MIPTMRANSIPVLVMCGITLYAGLFQLAVFLLRKEERTNLRFAFTCFSLALYDAMCVGFYNAASVGSGAAWQRGQFFAIALIIWSFCYYVCSLYERRITPFLRWYLAVVAAITLAGLAFPDLVADASAPNVRSIEFLGMGMTYYEARTGLVFGLQNLAVLVGMAYVLRLILEVATRRDKEHILLYLAGTSIYFASLFADILIANDLIEFPYTSEYAFFAVIVIMDLSMQKRFVALFREVETLNATLEDKVAARAEEGRSLMAELRTKNAELLEKNAELADLADRDGLTRLLNHAAFHRRLAEEFSASRRQRFSLAIAMIDIDLFKEINDRYGHQAGDKVILAVANILMHDSREYDPRPRTADAEREAPSIRLYDVPGRYGGDEFALLLPYCREADLMLIAERIRKKIEEIRIEGLPGLRIGASLGGATYDPERDGASSFGDLIQRADDALYRAKAAGRGRTVVAGAP